VTSHGGWLTRPDSSWKTAGLRRNTGMLTDMLTIPLTSFGGGREHREAATAPNTLLTY